MIAAVRAWVRRNLALAYGSLAAVLVLTLVAVIAIASGGYRTERVDLNDAGTWVVNGSENAIGRLNTQIRALDSAERSENRDVITVQNSAMVLVHATAQKELGVVDETLSTIGERIQLPTDSSEVLLSDRTVVVHAAPTGRVWFINLNSLDSFGPDSEPDLVLGKNSAVAVDRDGNFAGYSVQSGLIKTSIDATVRPESGTPVDLGSEEDEYAAAVLSGRAVILNRESGAISVDGGAATESGAAPGARLISSSVSAETIFIADSEGLLSRSFSDGRATRVLSLEDAEPAVPVLVDGCVFAAWGEGTLWSQCGTRSPETTRLEGLGAGAQLRFVARSGAVVLNDAGTGRAWMIQDAGQLVNNWDEILDDIEDRDKEEINDPTLPAEVDPVQKPPVAVDDVFGARPGRTSPLPVLLNDFDPNGDALYIDEVTGFPEEMGSVAIVLHGQQLSVSLRDNAAGEFTFGYGISDGHGGRASANVTVQVRTSAENNPPVQARRTVNAILPGGAFQRDILADWYDPDGDPFFLAETSIGAPDSATFAASGTVYYQDSGEGGASKSVGLIVSDGHSQGSGLLDIEVLGADVPIIAEPVTVSGVVGSELIASPLEMVRGGNGNVRLIGVPVEDREGIRLRVDTSSGDVSFQAGEPGTYLFEYQVGDGVVAASGHLRFEVTAAPEDNLPPVAVGASAFLYLGQTDTINILARDYDPAGGVLVITDVISPPGIAGLLVESLGHSLLRVSLSEPLPDGQTEFSYVVSNGAQSTTGTVSVTQVEPPAREKPPVAMPDRAIVRVGEVVDIDVLKNDIHPDGLPLTLSPTLARELSEDEGLLFTSGNTLRYLAPDKPGEYSATYVVESPGGESASAPVQISVREVDRGSNTAPQPHTVTARVTQGNTVRIQIPLSGIDDDGDSVTLTGLQSAPEKGMIVATGKDYFDYRAGDAEWGTDVFHYAVRDGLGLSGTAQIRVGIAEASAIARDPIARTDVLTVSPGTRFTVQPLLNDSDPDGGGLKIVDVEQSAEIPTEFTEDTVTLEVPRGEGVHSVLYTIESAAGGRSSAWIQVNARADAPPVRPIVEDTVLTLTDIAKVRETLAVDVWDGVFYAEGKNSDLELSSVPRWGKNLSVTAAGNIEIIVTPQAQILPFKVSVRDNPEISSYGFIWVPAAESSVPERRADAKNLTVASGERLVIPLGEQVIAAGDRRVRVADPGTVRATNSNGDNPVVNDTTLQFTSQQGYSGPASILLEVADGDPAGDANRATIVLPITVTPVHNSPPVLRGSTLSLEPSASRTLDLRDLTIYPYPEDAGDLVWNLPAGAPEGAQASLSGSRLTLSLPRDATVGAHHNVQIGVRDAESTVVTASIEVTVVTSTKPLAQALPDTIEVRRGSSATVDVLANDVGPAEFMPLSLISVEMQNAVPGLSAVASGNRSVTVTATQNAEIASNLRLTYRVRDASGAREREVTGTVTIVVVDVPEAPGVPTYLKQDHFGNDGALRISFAGSASSNGKPITEYRLRSTDGSVQVSCGLDTSSCTVTAGQAPVGTALRYVATATNSVGTSPEGPASAPLRIDFIPEAPTDITARQQPADDLFAPGNRGVLDISWTASVTPRGGTPANNYIVTVVADGAPMWTGSTAGTSISTPAGLPARGGYSVTVEARNNIDTSTYGAIQWNVGTGGATSILDRPGVPTLTYRGHAEDTALTVDWTLDNTGGGTPTYAAAWGNTAPECAAATGTATSASLPNPATGTHTLHVTVSNGWGCNTASITVDYFKKPGMPAAPSVTVGDFVENRTPVSVSVGAVAEGVIYRLKIGARTLAITPGVPLNLTPVDYDYNRTNEARLEVCNGDRCVTGPAASFLPMDLSLSWAGDANQCTLAGAMPMAIGAAGIDGIIYSYNVRPGGREYTIAETARVPAIAYQVIARARLGNVRTPDPLLSAPCGVSRTLLDLPATPGADSPEENND
ncbi:Ig-like domain-containing protein [Mycetocola spongiae]|uniref:Ig-like domain-containing protein n=1 Tax=Mycetocola spongiae TaxID=2859226 RepID=UPI001CF377B6|nr:Ig-like domain-containing protein [Mycetocola spongiae]UCR90192.1 hypothetical protein KXZ72_05910 [Mycetocola spongiae]